MSILQLCVCFIIGYIFGNIPNGYLYAKSQGVDIYHQGSGNPGSTNVLRTLGKRAGITVLLMDIAKCMVPIFLMILFWKPANEDQKTLGELFFFLVDEMADITFSISLGILMDTLMASLQVILKQNDE